MLIFPLTVKVLGIVSEVPSTCRPIFSFFVPVTHEYPVLMPITKKGHPVLYLALLPNKTGLANILYTEYNNSTHPSLFPAHVARFHVPHLDITYIHTIDVLLHCINYPTSPSYYYLLVT